MEFQKILIVFDKLNIENIPSDTVVLTSFPSDQKNVLDVHAFNGKRNEYVQEFEMRWKELLNELQYNCCEYHIVQSVRSGVFSAVFNIIGQWCTAIDYCVDNYDIKSIEFDVYCSSEHVFVYEAEGEVNRELLYKKWFYLPFYIEQYLKNKYPQIEVIKNRYYRKWLPFIFLYLRDILFLCYKLYRFGIYKLNIKKRKFCKLDTITYLLSSRGIVQTQFLKNFAYAHKEETLIIVNEQTNKPWANRKQIEKMPGLSYYYAEGNLPWITVLKLFFETLFRFLFVRNHNRFFLFNGIRFKYSSLIKDLLIRDFDYKLYTCSVDYFARRISPKLIVSFDMKTPHAYYLKQMFEKKRVIQIHTTLMEPKMDVDFVFTDYFYFTDEITYIDFHKKGNMFMHKTGCLPMFKYYGVKRKMSYRQSMSKIVYFTQPVELEEQALLILAISNFCLQNKCLFYIKIHPREKYVKPKEVCAEVIDGNEDYVELIKDCDVVVTRTSSIGLDCWVYGVPCIFARTTFFMANTVSSFIPEDYVGDVRSKEELVQLLQDYKLLLKEFKYHKLYSQLTPDKCFHNAIEI